MHVLGRWSFLVLCVFVGWSTGLGQVATRRFTEAELQQGYVSRSIIARPAHTADPAALTSAETREGRRLSRSFPRLGGLRIIEPRAGETADDAVRALRATGRYAFVEHDYIRRRHAEPNDPKFRSGEAWHLRNTGADGGVLGADINAPAAWATRTDASDVIVAVIDTGVLHSHEDLRDNLWRNPGEVPANGRDDDGNGYVDDVHGINTLAPVGSSAAGSVADDTGHGTAVSSALGAVGNNGLGTAGVAWRARIMILKFDDDAGSGSVSDEVACFDYAIAYGAKVINLSYGSVGYSQAEEEAIRAARERGVILVTSAGNEETDIGVLPSYPASYPLDNIVSVASTDRRDRLSEFSNYNSGIVDLAAPGSDIVLASSKGDSAYRVSSGTSFSAPLVAGALALTRAAHPTDDHRQTINRLLAGTQRLPALDRKVHTSGRLDLAGALSASAAPFNDAFDRAANLEGTLVTARANCAGATLDPGEPAHGSADVAGSVWWSWTAPETGTVTIETAGSTVDTVIAVYTGGTLPTLVGIATNDDADSGTSTSRATFPAVSGTNYHIAVANKTNVSGGLQLTLGYQPANDDLARAEPLVAPSSRTGGFNSVSSTESGEPTAFAGARGRTVWYRFTAPAASTYTFSLFAYGFDGVIRCYTAATGTSGDSFAALVAAESGSDKDYNNPLIRDLRRGETIHLQVDSLDHRTGYFELVVVDGIALPGLAAVNSSPTYNSGDARLISVDGYGFALFIDVDQGDLGWDYLEGTLDVQTPATGQGGRTYIGDDWGYLYAYDYRGKQLWRKDLGLVAIPSSPAIGSDGSIYVHSDDGVMHAFHADGTEKWRSTAVPGKSYSSPGIAPKGTIYIGSTDGHLYALSPVDGSRRWRHAVEGEVYSSPAIDAVGNAYFGTLEGKFYSVSPDGVRRWSFDAGAPISSSPALGVDGTVYFGCYDRHLYALRPDGTLRWRCATGDEIRASSPAVAQDGTIYIGSYDGDLHAVSPDGVTIRKYSTGAYIRSSPLLADYSLWIGSGDAQLYGIEIPTNPADSDWPMHRQNARRTGRRAVATAPVVIDAPVSQGVWGGSYLRLGVGAVGGDNMTFQWSRNGVAITSATRSTFNLAAVMPTGAGLYTVTVANAYGTTTTLPAIVGPALPPIKLWGQGTEVLRDTRHPNGNIFDQILLEGPAVSFIADPGQVTRLSYIDASDDIVQVEFTGPGTVSVVLEGATTPAAPAKYNQAVDYVKGTATIVVVGADQNSHLSVFSVGRATAVNQALFKSDITYDGRADIACIAIQSDTGRFGGLRTANTRYSAGKALTGVYAPGIAFSGPVFVGDITATDGAQPVLMLGSCSDVRVTGGDLSQANGRAVAVAGITALRFTGGSDSHGNALPARPNAARLEEDGTDVTSRVVVNP